MKKQLIEHGPEPEERSSRTQKKKAALELQKMGEALANLNEPQIEGLALPDMLRDALSDLRAMKKHEARRRQMQYIGSLMRQMDTTPIRRFLENRSSHAHEGLHRLKQVEQWRDAILAGNDECVEQLLGSYPQMDRRQLMQLSRSARKETEQQKPPRAARKLFKLLRDIIGATPGQGGSR